MRQNPRRSDSPTPLRNDPLGRYSNLVPSALLGRDSHLVPTAFNKVKRPVDMDARTERCEKGFTHQLVGCTREKGFTHQLIRLVAGVCLLCASVRAQDSNGASPLGATSPAGHPTNPSGASPTSESVHLDGDFAKLSAPQAVSKGNENLLAGDTDLALQAYEYAERLRPDSREIAFSKGLAHYERGEFDEARDAFRRVAGADQDELATDAKYSLATCDHAEALQNLDNPELAIERFESAMRQYHDVLANHPNHKPARDANYKAASMWRQIKRQQKEEQKKQDSDENKDEDKKDKKDKDDQKQESDKQDKNDEKNQDKKDQEQQQRDEQKADKQEQQKEQSAEQKEERVSREQAERKLREMVQAMREREKKRAEKVQLVPVRRVEKDW